MTKPFDGKVAFVAEGASGSGASIATRLFKGGATVALVDLNADNLATHARQLDPDGTYTRTDECDISNYDALKANISLKPGTTTTPEALISFCRARIATYNHSHIVNIVDELMKSSAGKILKCELLAKDRA